MFKLKKLELQKRRYHRYHIESPEPDYPSGEPKKSVEFFKLTSNRNEKFILKSLASLVNKIFS